jgi:hypothetical protein
MAGESHKIFCEHRLLVRAHPRAGGRFQLENIMSESIGFKFCCDACKYRCFLMLHYSGELTGYKCPKCGKEYEIIHQDTDKTVPDFVGTEASSKISGSSPSTVIGGGEILCHNSGRVAHVEYGKSKPSNTAIY